MGGDLPRRSRSDCRRSGSRDAHRARNGRGAGPSGCGRCAREFHAPHDGAGGDCRSARPDECRRDGTGDVGAGRRMHSHRARSCDPLSWRTSARGWAILRACDGQARRARTQPELGRRSDLSSRGVRVRRTAPKRRRVSANRLPRFCRRDAFESICGFGPAGAPRRWLRRSTARSTTTRTSASRGSAPRCCVHGRSRATSKLGFNLRAELNHFVFRSYLDFDTLRQLRAMKHQIEAELKTPAMIERNIKLGRGGIRELEFIVQALTLIYGGRDPAASNRADGSRARKARRTRIPALEARARTWRRLPVPARRRAQAASRRRPADARDACRRTTGCAHSRRGWGLAKDRRR